MSLVVVLLAGCGGGADSGKNGGGSSGGGSGSSTDVTFTFTGAAPLAVATKVGSGDFGLATLTSGEVSFSVPSGTTDFAVAYVCPPLAIALGSVQSQVNYQNVFEANLAGGTTYSTGCPAMASSGQTGTLAVNVDASALTGTAFLNIAAKNGSSATTAYVHGASTGNLNISAPTGSDRVEVLAYGQTTGAVQYTQTLLGAKFFDGQAVPGALNGGNPVVLTAADATTRQPVSYTDLPAGFNAPIGTASYSPASGGTIVLLASGALSEYPVMPASIARSGDLYTIQAQAASSSGSLESRETVGVARTISGASPVSLALPAPWAYAGPAPAALPTLDFDYAGFSGEANTSREATIGWAAGSNVQDLFTLAASSTYQNGAASLSFPDLSGLSGFLPAPASGTQVQWSAIMMQSSAGGTSANRLVDEVVDTGTYTVP